MKLKKTLSVLLIGVIVITALFCPMTTMAKADYSYKIDPVLAEKLEKMNDNDTISVSVWLKDIDYDNVKKRTNDLLTNQVPNDIICAVSDTNDSFIGFSKKELNMTKKEIKEEQKNIQYAICKKREIIKELQVSNINGIIKRLSSTITDEEIVYISKYVPNFEAKLTKEKINRLVFSKQVKSIYSINNNSKDFKNLYESFKNGFRDGSLTPEQRNEMIDEEIGLNILKNNYNLTGDGIKIGNIDWYLPDDTKDCFDNANNDNRLHLVEDIGYIPTSCQYDTSHQTYTTAIMIGNIDGTYEGISPEADMYCVATGNPNEIDNVPWKQRIDTLIDYGVNIINSSFEAYGDGRNVYGDSAKWIDAMINSTDVSFIQSSANDTIDSVISGGMAYNSIVVGNYDIENHCVNQTCSSYNSGNGDYKQYKPDIVAPGDYTVWYSVNDYIVGGGTSGAAPVLTGIAALLCERYPTLLTKPAFLKTSLLNGATYIGNENTANSMNSFVAFDRQSGAGIVNGNRSRIDYTTMHWVYGTHNYSINNYTIVNDNFHYINVTSALKPIHITVCSLKPLTREQYTANINYATFRITVIKGTNTWISECIDDNKCALRFTPTVVGAYKVRIERTDTNNINAKFALLYTSE